MLLVVMVLELGDVDVLQLTAVIAEGGGIGIWREGVSVAEREVVPGRRPQSFVATAITAAGQQPLQVVL